MYCILQAAALRFATPAKESRDNLVARLRDEQASQAARLEALKQVPRWLPVARTLPGACTVAHGNVVVSGPQPMYWLRKHGASKRKAGKLTGF